MQNYDSVNFQPPAPVAYVSVYSHDKIQSAVNVPMLLDSGADVSLVPRELLSQIIAASTVGQSYSLMGFDGTESAAPAIQLELHFLDKIFRGQFLIVDGHHGIIGRNILNCLPLFFDGPALTWKESR